MPRDKDAPTKTVLMIGDSFIGMGWGRYHLRERILNLVPPEYNLDIINESHYGQ